MNPQDPNEVPAAPAAPAESLSSPELPVNEGAVPMPEVVPATPEESVPSVAPVDPANLTAPAAPVPDATPSLASAPVSPPAPEAPAAPVAPMDPAAPAAPVAPEAPNPSVSAPVAPPASAPVPAPRGSNKKIFVILGVVVGALILGGVGLFVALSFLTVGKADFKAAYDNANDMRGAYTKMYGAAYISTSTTDTERTNAIDSLKNNMTTFDDAFKKLEEQKAIKRDTQAAALFNALKEKKVKFDAAMAATSEAYEFIALPISELRDVSSRNTSGIDKALTSFQDSKSKVKDANNKEFVEKMIPLLERYKTVAERYQAGINDYKKYDSGIASQYLDLASDVSNAIRDWSSNFQKKTDDAEINKEFNKLGEYLAEKASGN